MTPRGTDWTLALLTAGLVVSGLASWLWGEAAWIVIAHDIAGLALTIVVAVKFRRVWGRLARGAWDRRTALGLLALAVVWLTLGTGIIWAADRVAFAGFTLLAWHTGAGFVLAAAVLAHLLARAKRPRRRDVTDRRQALALGASAAAGTAVWLAQDPASRALGLRGPSRRFTGSYAAASFSGNAFPTTSWVADDPTPLDQAAWRLRIGGQVERRRALTIAQPGFTVPSGA